MICRWITSYKVRVDIESVTLFAASLQFLYRLYSRWVNMESIRSAAGLPVVCLLIFHSVKNMNSCRIHPKKPLWFEKIIKP